MTTYNGAVSGGAASVGVVGLASLRWVARRAIPIGRRWGLASHGVHPLALLLDAAAQGRFPDIDGRVEIERLDDAGTAAIVEFARYRRAMSKNAIAGLEAEVARAKELFATLSADEWEAPSGCEGWRVHDVAQHMAAVFQQIAAADTLEVDTSGAEGAEATAEMVVQARKGQTPEQVMAAYEEWSAKGVAALAALQEPPMADTVVPLGDLGSHPMHLLGDAIAFDHYCHLRHDIGASIERAASLPHDPQVLGPAVDWMLAGLPQMCAEALASAPQQPVNLVFDGPLANSWCLTPGDPAAGPQWVVANGADDDAPLVRTTAHDFISWATKRADWRRSSTGDVSHPDAARVLDAINVI